MASLKLNTPSGGSLTITPTDTASSYTLNLPSSNATILTTGAIGTTVQAYDSDLTAWAGKTAPTGVAVGTTDTQTLTNKTLSNPSISGTITFEDSTTQSSAGVDVGTSIALSTIFGF